MLSCADDHNMSAELDPKVFSNHQTQDKSLLVDDTQTLKGHIKEMILCCHNYDAHGNQLPDLSVWSH